MLSSLGQPLSLGFNPNQGYAVYASEPAAVDGVLGQEAGTYRLDLNQNTGEVAVLTAIGLTVYSMTENRELRDTELFKRRLTYPAPQPLDDIASDPVAQTCGQWVGQDPTVSPLVPGLGGTPSPAIADLGGNRGQRPSRGDRGGG